jgi:protocatechuate 3,4-dioxygenase beta subunit
MTTTENPRPTFEGRVLPLPDEPPYDQGLGFDLHTLLDRRRALSLLGLGVAGAALAACGSTTTAAGGTAGGTAGSSTSGSSTTGASSGATSGTSTGTLTEIPDETAGPYPGDGSNGPDVLAQSGVVRQDITSSFGTSTTKAEGIPMTLELTILDIAAGGGPMAGAAVYVWHCDRAGRYSMYSSGVTAENYLRGVQIADSNGVVRFTSIVPGCYSGRWPHIHFEVYPDQASIADSTKAIATSQVALPKPTCDAAYATAGYEASVGNLARLSLASDNVFGNDGGVHQLGTATGDPTSGYAVRLTVPVDTRTAPTGGGGPGGPGSDGAPPGMPPTRP